MAFIISKGPFSGPVALLIVVWLVKIISVLNWPLMIVKANVAFVPFALPELSLSFRDAVIALMESKLVSRLARKDKAFALLVLPNVDFKLKMTTN